MKRFIALALAVLMVAAFLCACGEEGSSSEPVTTTVNAKYDDGAAKNYAKSTTTDENGNTVYEFEAGKYEEFIQDYQNQLGGEISADIASGHEEPYGQYAYVNPEKKAVIVGLNEGDYDEATAKAEAEKAAEYGFKYFQNLKEPVNTISVIFCNANNQDEVYGSFEFTAE